MRKGYVAIDNSQKSFINSTACLLHPSLSIPKAPFIYQPIFLLIQFLYIIQVIHRL